MKPTPFLESLLDTLIREVAPRRGDDEVAFYVKEFAATLRAASPQIDAEINAPGFLAQWVGTLTAGRVLNNDDVLRLYRVELALRNADKHHAQARAVQNLTAADHIAALQSMGATKLTDECGNFTNGYVQVVWVCQSMYTVLILPPEMTP
jgi:hypothetical protein